MTSCQIFFFFLLLSGDFSFINSNFSYNDCTIFANKRPYFFLAIWYDLLQYVTVPPCAGSSRKSRKDTIMEIERKFLVMTPPENYESFPCHVIEQAYLCTEPVIRVRKEDDTCYLTYKSKGLLVREEYNLPLTKEAYAHLLTKADGNILTKKRYLIPVPGREDLTVEFDVFEGKFAGLMLAEIEFSSEEDARAFPPLSWFDRDVTWSGEYQNSRLSKMP